MYKRSGRLSVCRFFLLELMRQHSRNKKEADKFVYFFVVEISGSESLTLCGLAAHPPQADF
jgi:hypothetical protein